MQMMHNGDDYSMKENMLNMMNNKERRESDNQNRYETGQYQNYRNRAWILRTVQTFPSQLFLTFFCSNNNKHKFIIDF